MAERPVVLRPSSVSMAFSVKGAMNELLDFWLMAVRTEAIGSGTVNILQDG